MSYSTAVQRRPSRIRTASAPDVARATAIDVSEPTRTKTGRISKALKGLRVHRCPHPQCGKIYSRLEHLKRHQYNHQRSPLQCKSCHKPFFRRDLLERHVLKYGHPSNHSPSSSPDRETSSIDSYCPSHISTTSALLPDSSVTMATMENVKEMLASTGTAYPSFVTSLEPISARPRFQTEPHIWQPVPMSSEYPILPPSPISGVSSPWLAAGYTHPALPVVDSIEPYQNVYPSINTMPSINSHSPPESATSHFAFEHERSGVPTSSTSSSPAPLSAAVPPILLPVTGNGTDELFYDSQLSGILIPSRKKTYTDAYWKHFHPVFPVIHSRQRFNQSTAPPKSFEASARHLLAVTMMAVGAQYSDQWFAPSDSRILLEKCLDIIHKNKASIISTLNLELMQAVVLAEFLLQFKAKRAPEALSDSFCTVYDNLWHWHFAQSKTTSEELGRVIPGASEEAVYSRWNDWIEFHSRERLLATFYILDTRNALLLGRQMHITDPALGLELSVPASSSTWDAHNPSRWTQALLCQRQQPATINGLLEAVVCQVTPEVQCDNFQSSVVLACYSASISHSHDAAGLACPTHVMFEASRSLELSNALSNHLSIQIMHAVIRLISFTPFRALVSTAGESWFFGRKLSDVAREASEEFTRLKSDLKAWTSDVTTASVIDPPHGSNTAFMAAVAIALDIINMAIADGTPGLHLSFGPELALYFAALVLWAATYSCQRATGADYDGQDADAAEWDSLRAGALVRNFLPIANADIKEAFRSVSIGLVTPHSANPLHPSLVGNVGVGVSIPDVFPALVPGGHTFAAPVTAIFPPPQMLCSWRSGVGSIIRWTAWVLGGAANMNSGTGQLVTGSIEVLETLGRTGWSSDWF